MKESEDIKHKMIFAKATALNFCAIVVYTSDDILIVCDVVTSKTIENFIVDVEVVAKKHLPYLLNYECSVYLHECRDLREVLNKENIKVRGYKSEGAYKDRIISQASWISNNVSVDEEFDDFIYQVTSFSLSDTDKTNIALDVLSDATKYFRRNIFK